MLHRACSCCTKASLVLAAVCHFAAPASFAEEKNWPNWRGPSGQGYSSDTQVPLTWSETENLLWKTELPGQGNSSPIVWGERLFLTAASHDGKERSVVCIRASDGKILWQKPAAQDPDPAKTHAWNGHASASCTTDGQHVYAFFGTPGLFCFDYDGNLVWKHTFGIFTSKVNWGTAASPFLYEDVVIQNCDNDGAEGLPSGVRETEAAPMALVALDRHTGKIRWQTPRNQGRGFSTPRLITTPQGRTDLVLNGPLGVWAYDPKTGKEVWHCERKGDGDQNKNQAHFGEPMPVSSQDAIFAPSGRPGPFQAIRMGGTGDVTATNLVWEIIRGKSHRDVASPILWGEHIYSADSKGFLTCYEAKNGQVVFDERIGSKALASPVAVRGKLLFLLDDGVTLVVEPGRKLKIAGKNKLGDGSQLAFGASPAIANGRLFLRSQTHLYCVGDGKQSSR